MYKNKTIPADTPPYLKKGLEHALIECQQGVKKEKSALENFAQKYIFDGEAKVTPKQYFVSKATELEDFFRNLCNIKTRLVLICLVEEQDVEKRKTIFIQAEPIFNRKVKSILKQQM